MAELGLAAIPVTVATLVAVLVAVRWRRRLAAARSAEGAPVLDALGTEQPTRDAEPEAGTPTPQPFDAEPPTDPDHELRVLRLLVRSLEELVEEQAVEIGELTSRTPPAPVVPAPVVPDAPAGLAGAAPATAQPADDAGVVRQALSALSGPDAEARLAAALAVLDTPRTFTRPVVADVSTDIARQPDPAPAAPAAPEQRPAADDVPTREDLPRTPPAEAGPEVVLPVPAPPAPATPSRRRLFRSRAA